MKIFILARSCEGTGLAHRLAKSHEVYLYTGNKTIGRGMVNKAKSQRVDDSFDLAIVTGMGFGKEEDSIGVPKIGASFLADAIANDIDYRRKFIEMCGLPFWTPEESISFEIFGLFNGEAFAEPLLAYYTDERLGEGDLSSLVESMGCTLRPIRMDGKATEMTYKVGSNLKEVKYRGPVNLRVNVTDNMRGVDMLLALRYDFFCAFLEGLKTPIEEVFLSLALGELKEFDFFPDPQVAVRMTMPPYPYVTAGLEPQQIYGINEQNEKHIYFRDLIFDEGKYICNRIENIPLIVTAHGSDIKKATTRAYRTISYLTCDNAQYRRDVGKKAEEVFAFLEGEGWI